MTQFPSRKRFILVYLGISIVIPVLFFLIRMLFGVDLTSAGVSIVPMMIAAMVEGQKFAEAENRRPESKEGWKIALHMAVLAFLMTVVLGIVAVLALPELLGWFADPAFLLTLTIIALLFFGLFFLLGRLFFALGVRNQLKVNELKAAREKSDKGNS